MFGFSGRVHVLNFPILDCWYPPTNISSGLKVIGWLLRSWLGPVCKYLSVTRLYLVQTCNDSFTSLLQCSALCIVCAFFELHHDLHISSLHCSISFLILSNFILALNLSSGWLRSLSTVKNLEIAFTSFYCKLLAHIELRTVEGNLFRTLIAKVH